MKSLVARVRYYSILFGLELITFISTNVSPHFLDY